MMPNSNVCVVGGNAVSAFLSWRLQATNACDVTLVWKTGFEHVSQYGISFKYVPGLSLCITSARANCSALRSPIFGNERFKPRHGMFRPPAVPRCRHFLVMHLRPTQQ